MTCKHELDKQTINVQILAFMYKAIDLMKMKKTIQPAIDKYKKGLVNPLQSLGMFGVQAAENLWKEKELAKIFDIFDKLEKFIEDNEAIRGMTLG